MTEQEKEPAQLSHIGLDLTEGVVSLFGERRDGLVRFRFFLPPGLQQLLSTHPLTEQAVRALLVTDESEPEGSLTAGGERSAAFFRSTPVDGTLADLARAHPAAE